MSITERIEASGLSILRCARIAGVRPTRLYHGARLDPDEISAIEEVLSGVSVGKIPLRRVAP